MAHFCHPDSTVCIKVPSFQYFCWNIVGLQCIHFCVWVYAHFLSHIQLFATPWTVAHQAPLLTKEFSR